MVTNSSGFGADGGGVVRQDRNVLDANQFANAGDTLRVDVFFGTPCGDALLTLGRVNVFA